MSSIFVKTKFDKKVHFLWRFKTGETAILAGKKTRKKTKKEIVREDFKENIFWFVVLDLFVR